MSGVAVLAIERDKSDLDWFWNEREAHLGLRTTYGLMLHRAARLSRPTAEVFAEPRDPPEGHREASVWRALAAMDARDVQVLYASYGPRDPAARVDALWEPTARLAPYTKVIEAHRVELAHAMAEERVARARAGYGSVLGEAALERVRVSHLRGALREVTASDALRAILGPRREETANRWFHRRHPRRSLPLIEVIHAEARALLGDALLAYRRARCGE
jgi:hypothetical protein